MLGTLRVTVFRGLRFNSYRHACHEQRGAAEPDGDSGPHGRGTAASAADQIFIPWSYDAAVLRYRAAWYRGRERFNFGKKIIISEDIDIKKRYTYTCASYCLNRFV